MDFRIRRKKNNEIPRFLYSFRFQATTRRAKIDTHTTQIHDSSLPWLEYLRLNSFYKIYAMQ